LPLRSTVFSNVYLSCDHCCQLLWIVLFWLPLRSSVFSNVYLSCDHCCQLLWIVLFWLPLRSSVLATEQINGGEYRRGNQKRTIQRNWQQWLQDK
jgi:hypothetical protein